jgi:hypothetical protein
MQPVKPNVERHLNPAHDPGFHVIQGDLEAGDFHPDDSFPSLVTISAQKPIPNPAPDDSLAVFPDAVCM